MGLVKSWRSGAAVATVLTALVGCGGSTSKVGAEPLPGPEPEVAWGKACPGASDEGDGARCRSQDECAEGLTCQSYRTPPCSTSFGDCYEDRDCEDGQVCGETGLPSCTGAGPERTCRPSCSAVSCPAGDACGDDGHCRPLSCSAGFACADDQVCAGDADGDEHGCRPARCERDAWSCPVGYECRPGDEADQHGCEPISCTAGFECPVNTRCRADSLYLHTHQCEALTCAQDSDCDCGYCIGSYCRQALAYCTKPPIG